MWHHAGALTFTPATAGLYHVAVGGPATAPGPYTLTVDEPPTPGSRRSRTLAGATPTAAPAPQRSTAAPDKPRGLTATATHDGVVLTWDDPQDASITGYVILRRVRENDVGGKFRVLVADTGSAATTYTDATVSANTTYTYRIKAINAHGVSERSRWFHIDIPAAPEPAGQAAEPPAKPTGLSATATHNTVVLTWNAPGDASITGYVILRRVRENDTGGAFGVLVADTGTAATTYTDDTVAAETIYTYRIKAINAHGVSARSRWVHIDIPAAPEAVEGDDSDGEDGGAPGYATPPGPGGRANVSEGNTDFPNDTTTTGEVEVGGTVTGNIGTVGDYDRFKVELEAGTRYQLDLEGADTGRGTLADPHLGLYDAIGSHLQGDNGQLGDDNSGVGANARMIYTPDASGDFYPVVTEINDNLTGTYTLSVIVLGANGASEADTDFPADNTTSGRVEVGASATGNIGIANDYDWFRVDLEAGKTYQIDLKGIGGGGGTLENPYLVNIRDSSGTAIDGTENDDVDPSNDIYDSQTVYTPTAAGTYYLVAVSGVTGGTGTYTLSVRDITTPPCTLNTGDIWCGVVTVGELKSSADVLVGHGFADGAGLSAGGLAGNPDETMFSVGDNDYTIQGAYIQVPTGANPTGTLFVLLSADLTDDDKAGLLLTVDGTTTPFAFSGATQGSTGLYSWGLSGLDWSSTTTVTVRVRPRTLSVADASDAENDGEVEFTVTLSEAATEEVTATWTASIEPGDTAAAADLGSTKTGTVTVAIGDTTETFTVPVVNDATDEGDETFTVTLSSPSSNAKLETDPTAKGTIEDDDPTALSMDATLSGLSLGTGVTLSPAFASGTVTYTASVANSVGEVTVTPTTNHARATVEILDTDDNALDDADDMEDDFQVTLSVGDTVIKVKVTAEDDTSTQTYTVTVTRAAEMTPDDPPDDSGNVPEPVTDLLSNLGQANNVNFAIAVGDFENAQGFTTGSDSYGYFLASISLDVNAVPKTPADVTVSLWSATSDSPPKPDASVATLTHSTGTWATGVNTFNAPGGTVLDPGTTYFVVQSYSGARAHLSLRVTASGSADDDSTGWSVAGARLTRSRTDLGDWSGQSGEYTKFSVSGAAVPAQGVAEGATDLPADTSTGGVVEVDGFGARGAIHPPIGTSIDIGTLNDPEISTTYVFDTDWFAVELEAGRTYRIDMKGQILSSPGLDTAGEPVDPELTLSLPQINAIYDADGDYLLNTWARDESSAHHLFRVTFHARAGGTYYIAASGESFEWGGYELRVIDITEDTD